MAFHEKNNGFNNNKIKNNNNSNNSNKNNNSNNNNNMSQSGSTDNKSTDSDDDDDSGWQKEQHSFLDRYFGIAKFRPSSNNKITTLVFRKNKEERDLVTLSESSDKEKKKVIMSAWNFDLNDEDDVQLAGEYLSCCKHDNRFRDLYTLVKDKPWIHFLTNQGFREIPKGEGTPISPPNAKNGTWMMFGFRYRREAFQPRHGHKQARWLRVVVGQFSCRTRQAN